MGQKEIYDLLKKNSGKWINSKEITEKLQIGKSSISTTLQRLRKNKFVFFRLNKEKRNSFEYMVKESGSI